MGVWMWGQGQGAGEGAEAGTWVYGPGRARGGRATPGFRKLVGSPLAKQANVGPAFFFHGAKFSPDGTHTYRQK